MAVDEESIYKRPYFFELFTLVNLAVIWALCLPRGFGVLPTMMQSAKASGAIAGQVLLGVAIRLGVAAARGGWRDYLRRIRTVGWLTDTLRLFLFTIVMIHTYGWIKLTVPVFHPRLFDAELWNLDQFLFFGHSPTIFLLTLFRPILRAFDWSYANIFIAAVLIAFSYFLSAPERRLRAGFANGNTAMWIAGAWLYMALPSIGPVYHFPDVWFEYSRLFPTTQYYQIVLMRNYQAMMRLAAGGRDEPIVIVYGVAAFPSLHVAFLSYTFLWFRRLWRYGEIVFGIFVFVIFLGSMITGWHYMIDGLAGFALAALCYVGARKWAFPPPENR
ncbi:MAG TPA: phosphatase PAP2 family protein [Thermoanaerobaculia bacterium]|nr:phosphatase PAP2 family protein [Thermoanaerobaculia bacterium]